MALKKTAGIKKQAMNSFRTVRTPVDAEGRMLKKDKRGKYVHIDDESPLPAGERPKKTVSRQVMTEDDLLNPDNFPLLAKTMRCKKYKDLIQKLREAVNTSRSGIVNFVIGEETETAEAVLKFAFPPGSGTVYKGTEGGYNIDGASWANPDESLGALTKLLKGSPASIDEDSMSYYYRVSEQMNKEWEDSEGARTAQEQAEIRKWEQDVTAWRRAGGAASGPEPERPKFKEAPPKPLTPIDTIVGQQRSGQPAQGQPAATGRRTPEGAAAPAAAAPAVDPVSASIAKIRQLEASIRAQEEKISEIRDKNDEEKDASGWSPRKKYISLRATIQKLQSDVATIRNDLLKHQSEFGEVEYDKTGFMDFKGEATSVFKKFKKAIDVEGSLDAEIKAGRLQPKTDERQRKLQLVTIYNQNKEQIVLYMKSVKNAHRNSSNGKAIGEIIDKLVDVLNQGYDSMVLHKRALDEGIHALGNKINELQKVMVVNNAHERGLCERITPSDPKAPVSFIHSSLLANHFASPSLRQGRSIVFVSRVPINFGFTVTVVPDNPETAFSVDDEEGIALVDYFLSERRNGLAAAIESARRENKPAPSPHSISVNSVDMKRITQIISGKTQMESMNFLSQVFKATINPDNQFDITGSKLVKTARDINNEQVRQGAAWMNDEGKSKAMYRSVPKLTMDHYIYSKKSNWGNKVKLVNSTADTYKSKMAYLSYLETEAQRRRLEGDAEGAVELDAECAKEDREARALIRGEKHFLILYGLPGCGKSAYPQALANKFDFTLVDADLAQARGSLVGQTERWGKAMIESWKKMSDVVIRLDEVDNMTTGDNPSQHDSHLQSVMKALLDFFQNDEEILLERNIFIVATTNNINAMRSALVGRAESHEVPQPFDVEGYSGYLKSAVDILKGDLSVSPYSADDVTSSDGWQETKRFWDGLMGNNYERVAMSLLKSGLNFRQLGAFICKMFHMDLMYKDSLKMVNLYNSDRRRWLVKNYGINGITGVDAEGKPIKVEKPKLQGFPFTVENLVRAATLTYPTDAKGNKLESFRPGEEVKMVHQGTIDLLTQFENEREGIHGGTSNAPAAPGTPIQGEMFGDSVTDDLLMPDASRATVASTDYYFDHLVKAGIVHAAQEVPPVESEESMAKRMARIAKGDIRNGDFCENGSIAVYPIV